MFRVVVQDARQTPTSGKVVTLLGSYDPHAKALLVDKTKVGFYLEHGAQPSERLAHLLQADGIKLPGWAAPSRTKQGKLRHTGKLRRNRPQEAAAPSEPETSTEAAPADEAQA